MRWQGRTHGDHLANRQAVLVREFEIALVVAGHRHHRAGAVAHQHEIRDPYRHRLATERMDDRQSRVVAFLFLRFQFGFRHAAVPASFDEGGEFWIAGSRLHRQRMFGRHGNVGHAHQGVRSRGKNTQRRIPSGHGEIDLESLAAADPVALHRLDRIGPAVQGVQSVEQLLRVVRDLQEPLRNLAFFNDRAAAPASSIHHLLVGQHGLVDRIPVHDAVLAIDDALAEQAGEHQLFPAVIVRPAGRNFARPVDRVAKRLQLPTHVLDVGVGPLGRRGVVLDGGVFSRQSERIPTHRLQYIEPAHAAIAADHIANRVVADVAHVQGAGWIRQHRQAVVLGPVRVFHYLEGAGGLPVRLRGGLDGLRGVGSGLGNVMHGDVAERLKTRRLG